jgi:hypothetical protein
MPLICVLLAGASLASSARGAELELRHHRRAAPAPREVFEPSTFELEGELERRGDGYLVLALPLRRTTRARLARAQEIPMARVPTHIRRALRIAPRGLAPASIDLRVGERVRAVLTRDRSGQTFVVDLRSPR